METFSALLAICPGNSPVKRLSKHWWGWWIETPFRPFWRHCNGAAHNPSARWWAGSVVCNLPRQQCRLAQLSTIVPALGQRQTNLHCCLTGKVVKRGTLETRAAGLCAARLGYVTRESHGLIFPQTKEAPTMQTAAVRACGKQTFWLWNTLWWI